MPEAFRRRAGPLTFRRPSFWPLADGQARLAERLSELGEVGMSAVLPDERDRAMFPTVGHAVAGHPDSTCGRTRGTSSAWRRAAGYQPLSEIFA